ncbi:hypothetical protein [Tenacibaculum sp.]|uniref:hypothetical protein n=1 Tax=Tenacibaculum sp. TaxID=1906242 RepID=UPI003AA85CF8
MGKNFGNKYITTKRIDQFYFFTKNGSKVEFLNFLKIAENNTVSLVFDNVTDILDIMDLMEDGIDTSKPLSLPIRDPYISVAFELLGLISLQQYKEGELFIEEVMQQEIDEAKVQGLEATRRAISQWNHNKEYQWELLLISKETTNKLLSGEFKTFEEFQDFNVENRPDEYAKTEILYRKKKNKVREGYDYIIETIFINE